MSDKFGGGRGDERNEEEEEEENNDINEIGIRLMLGRTTYVIDCATPTPPANKRYACSMQRLEVDFNPRILVPPNHNTWRIAIEQ